MYVGLSNSKFPLIVNDIAMRLAVADKAEIRFMEQPNGTTVCSYVVSCEGTFDGAYNREARGIVFDKEGRVISRPLHKFHNVNEKEATHVANLPWDRVTRVMNKRDGSMIHTVAVQSTRDQWPASWKFDLKSKKSFTSDVAVSAKQFLFDDLVEHGKSKFATFCNHCVDRDLTAIFEWTAPTARIVVYYPNAGLQLLHIRDNHTGEYFTRRELEALAAEYDIPVVEHPDEIQDMIACDPQMLLDHANVVEGIEGWVIQFDDGDMVKLKTKWYMERHRAMTFLRERDIARMVVNESIDDLKSLLVGEKADISRILEIERMVVADIDRLIDEVNTIFNEWKHLSRKDFAIKFGRAGLNTPVFPLLMQKFSGKEPDYKGYFERKFLPEFPLRQLNLVQSVAEVE